MLGSLPDELILQVVSHFACIWSYDPQATAFKKRSEEAARQRENRERQLVLYALCLASHRLRRIATPILYASFVSSATRYSFEPVQLFHRTILSPTPVLGLKIRLGDCLQYVENRLSDYLGNSLYKDSEFEDAIFVVEHYYYLLADIVNHAPNLRHMTVVSMESNGASLWRHLMPDGTTQPCRAVAGHGLRKLQSLSLQIDAKGYVVDDWSASFIRICSALTSLPMLSDLRASGVSTSYPTSSLTGAFDNMQRVDITECVLEFDEISQIWAACTDLRHISCEWAFLYHEGSTSDLYAGLLRHSKTLETLNLDTRQVRMSSPQRLGLLRPFTSLKSLSLCERALGIFWSLLRYPEHLLEDGISELIPQGLQILTLCVYDPDPDHRFRHDSRLERASALWDLANDLKHMQTDVRRVRIKCERKLGASNLIEAFRDAGVLLDFVNDTKTR